MPPRFVLVRLCDLWTVGRLLAVEGDVPRYELTRNLHDTPEDATAWIEAVTALESSPMPPTTGTEIERHRRESFARLDAEIGLSRSEMQFRDQLLGIIKRAMAKLEETT